MLNGVGELNFCGSGCFSIVIQLAMKKPKPKIIVTLFSQKTCILRGFEFKTLDYIRQLPMVSSASSQIEHE